MRQLSTCIQGVFLLVCSSFIGGGQLSAQNYSLGYSGNNLWNPGIQIGADLPLQGTPSWHWIAQFGGFWDPDSYVGMYAQIGIGYELSVSEVTNIQLGVLPVGVFRSFLPQTFSVNDLGEVSQVTLPGTIFLAPAIRGRWCRMLRLMEGEWFLGLQGMLLTPYNTYSLPLLQVEAGVRIPVE